MAVELYQQPQAPTPPPAAPGGGASRRDQQIKGRKKAAVLLVALGPERAAEVFKHLHYDEIESLSLEMAKLQHIDPVVTGAVMEELAATVAAYESLAAGGVDYARDVLERAIGSERAAEIIGRLSSVIEMRPFEFLRRTAPEQIVAFLRNEAPQTVALVVANLHTTLAAQVLSNHPRKIRLRSRCASRRWARPVLTWSSRLRKSCARSSQPWVQNEYTATGGVKSLAEILNHADRPTERNVLDSLTESDEELAAEVRRLLFVFEDVVKLDDRSIQLVLREADQKDLALALRGVSEDVRDRVLQNMSERGAQMLLEEMEYQPPQRKRIVEEAQGRIVAIVRRLEEAGAVVISRNDADVMF